MTKLQITLTDQEAKLLASKAAGLGYDVTRYVKYILAREAEEALENIPIFKASSSTEKLIREAIEEDEKGLTKNW